MLKKVGIFLGTKYEPLSDPPSLKYVSGAPGTVKAQQDGLGRGTGDGRG